MRIQYFAYGEQGARGGVLKPSANFYGYELSVSSTTKELRVLAYLPGCQFDTLVLTPGMRAEQKLECRPLRTIELRGRIQPTTFLAGKAALVEVRYLAFGAHEFFNIADGMVPQFTIAKVTPDDKDGSFKTFLPAFAEDSVVQRWRDKGRWQLFLREINTGNILAHLKPIQYVNPEVGLEVSSSYPDVVIFEAAPW